MRLETVDEEEGAQFAHRVPYEIVRDARYYCSGSRQQDFGAGFEKSSRKRSDRLAGSPSTLRKKWVIRAKFSRTILRD